MKFLTIIDNLIDEYSDNMIVRESGTLLLAPDKIPRCQHMIYAPLPKEYYETHLISLYQQTFPEEYLYFLQHVNGADLCTIRLKTPVHSFAHSLFVILGLPTTPPYARKRNMEEPYDIRFEDRLRHPQIPENWLKCGVYTKDYNFDVQNQIFIDTITHKVYSCERDQKDIVESWNNLDECFCSIYNSLADRQYEYMYLPPSTVIPN